ncbi:MAG: PfkB family carbohydrate kinase [Chloroflexota bacterium]
MYRLPGAEPIDYLLLGHLSEDVTPDGLQLGGSVAYAALTAHALGMRVGIVTSSNEDMVLGRLSDIPIVNIPSDHTTSFENVVTKSGRTQMLLQQAEKIDYYQIPELWRQAPIVHVAPIAQEISASILSNFDGSLLCLTPQGWLRDWDEYGNVSSNEWPEADYALRHGDAVVISKEDVDNDPDRINEMAVSARILVITDAKNGADLYINGEIHHVDSPVMQEVDSTGAGDIFSAAFFVNLKGTNNPLEAAEFATRVAALSVTRAGLESIPTKDDIYDLMNEVRKVWQ